MRPLGLLLVLAACTVDNPAFYVTATEGGTAGATTDPTRPGTGPGAPTTAATEPPVPTGTGPDATTDGPTTSSLTTDATSTTDIPGTATTDGTAATTATGTTTDTGPGVCIGFDDPLGPLVPLLTAQGHLPIDTPDCAELQDMPLHGRLTVKDGGFDVVEHLQCPGSELPGDGIHVPVPLPQLPFINDTCVGLRYAVHPEYFECTLAEITVTHANKPVFVGSFGVAPFAKEVLAVSYTGLGMCDCPGCCGDDPAPDLYSFQLPMHPPVLQDGSLTFFHDGHKFQFMNLRSHIHAPDCLTADMPRADWLHFDWMAYRVP